MRRQCLMLFTSVAAALPVACAEELPTEGATDPQSGPAAQTVVATNTFTVTNTADHGPGSLRQAIMDANANAGLDLIDFDIPGTGPHAILPLSQLPVISDPVILDGYTQPEATPNTNGPALGSNAVPMIELDGSQAVAANGLHLSAGGSTIRGLVINRFDQVGIVISHTGGNVVEGNFIGTDVTGSVAAGNGWTGLTIAASDNRIGGTSPESPTWSRATDLPRPTWERRTECSSVPRAT